MSGVAARRWAARAVLAVALPGLPLAALAAGRALAHPVAAVYAGALALLAVAAIAGPLAWPAQSRASSAELVGVTAVAGGAAALDAYVASLALGLPAAAANPPALAVACAVYLAATGYAFASRPQELRLTWPLAPIAAAGVWLLGLALA
jgi:hypothetical protein